MKLYFSNFIIQVPKIINNQIKKVIIVKNNLFLKNIEYINQYTKSIIKLNIKHSNKNLISIFQNYVLEKRNNYKFRNINYNYLRILNSHIKNSYSFSNTNNSNQYCYLKDYSLEVKNVIEKIRNNN